MKAALWSAVFLLLPGLAFAQHEHAATPAPDHWVWSGQGQAFLNLNLQRRKFTDFNQIESQNWAMGSGTRQWGRTRVTFHAMLSAEPWTLRRLGSAQVLQLGETLDGAPLLDYQHPHDLIMGLEARVAWAASERMSLFVSGGPVAPAALGPPPFMHRPSAGPNPTAPLSHHNLDSSHITHGVVTVGATRGAWTLDTSVFRGREPDEDRLALDMGPLDSVSGRVAWHRGAWRAQISTGRLNEPEPAHRGDVIRSTASMEYAQTEIDGRQSAWMAAWGRNDRASQNEDGWLIEGRRDITLKDILYGRAELVDRFILVDFDYAAQTGLERHLRSWVAALTIGYERAVLHRSHITAALGTDVTLHQVSKNLQQSYGHPVSWHVFLRVSAR